MDTSYRFRIKRDDNQWGGKNPSQEERKDRRQRKLQALLFSIKANDLEAARQAYIALVNFDLALSNHPYLKEIGSALESNNLHSAQYFAKEIALNIGQIMLGSLPKSLPSHAFNPRSIPHPVPSSATAINPPIGDVDQILNRIDLMA
jgi:hypothetical protein